MGKSIVYVCSPVYRTPRTVLRINDVEIGQLNETVDEY